MAMNVKHLDVLMHHVRLCSKLDAMQTQVTIQNIAMQGRSREIGSGPVGGHFEKRTRDVAP